MDTSRPAAMTPRRALLALSIALLCVGGALVAACGDDIRCFAPNETQCGIGDASTDATDASDATDTRVDVSVGGDADAGG